MSELKLLPCPFCGEHATEIATCMQLEECAHFEECPAAESYVCMVCSIDKGGCGASTGYYDSAEKANAAWNRRAQPENEPLTFNELVALPEGTMIAMIGPKEAVLRGDFEQYGVTYGAYRLSVETPADATTSSIFPIHYCPMCGRKLERSDT